ncbi:MAG: DUF1461 domain-containing protein [Candidatus Aenigmarchaeota archaeon]|nr:DUF1461 domain-containing protein [Candidatus Aenigmarchaeota archaeon]
MKKFNRLSKSLFVLSSMKFIFIVSLILSIVLWSIPVLSFNTAIWSFFQEKNGVDFTQDAGFYNSIILEFLEYGTKVPFLNEQEFSHMQDVRRVIVVTNVIFFVSFLALLSSLNHLTKTNRRFMIKTIRITSIAVFILSSMIFLLLLANFDYVFDAFHKILFERNFIFPASSILKILYPDEFFLGLGTIYLLSIIVVSLAAAIISHRLKLK